MANVLIIDATTGDAETRSETDEEKADRKIMHEQFLLQLENTETKQTAKLAVLNKLGLTANEAAALFG